jgi:eukaryotic-like serine/threonine-protein kinase
VRVWGLCRLHGQPAEDLPRVASRLGTSPEIRGGASETQAGDVVGTPKYMSPEQAQGRNQELDARSDQCALGLILFELVTLTSPYAGRTAYEVMINAAMGRRRPVVAAYRRLRIPREIKAVVERATAASPADRYANVADFAADIRRFLRGEAVLAQPDTAWQRLLRWVSRHRQTMLIAVLATFAIGASAIGWLIWRYEKQAEIARAHEASVIALHDAVARVGDRVQTRFVQLEGAMKNLADSTAQASDYGAGSDMRYYLQRDFTAVGNAPGDLTASTLHEGKVSLQWAAWSIPAGMADAEGTAFVRRVAPMQPFVRDVYRRAAAMIRSADGNFYAEAVPVTTDDDSAIMAVAVGFSNGIYSRYPGWDSLPAGFDPRTRPWYRIAVDKTLPTWGEPYLSSVSKLTELPLSVPMIDGNERFVGVASALLLPERIVDSLFDIRGVPGILGIYLLDREGHVAAGRGRPVQQQHAADEGIESPFPHPGLVARVGARQGGVLKGRLFDRDVVMAFDIIDPIGWSIVAVADASVLFDAGAIAR